MTLTPVNIIADFCKCYIHPFNRQTISLSHEAPADGTKLYTTEKGGSIMKTPPKWFLLLSKLNYLFIYFVEGCDIYEDHQYIKWPQLTHPEVVPNSMHNYPFKWAIESTWWMFLQLVLSQWTTKQIMIYPHTHWRLHVLHLIPLIPADSHTSTIILLALFQWIPRLVPLQS